MVAGDLARLVDRQGEGLGGVRTDTVRRGDRKRVRTARVRSRRRQSAAVPSPLSVNVTPVGSVPVSDSVELGTPVVVTVKVPAWPVVKMVPAGLVIPGASVRRRAPCAIWRVAAAARTAPVALCVAIDPGRRGAASAACAWLSDPMATANMVRTSTSFLYIDSVPRSA